MAYRSEENPYEGEWEGPGLRRAIPMLQPFKFRQPQGLGATGQGGEATVKPAPPPPPEAVETPVPFEVQFPSEFRDAERAALLVRREKAGVKTTEKTTGLALSGGGIRSATFCLGVLQGLAGRKFLRKVDVISTVSGGGYTGSFLGCLFTRDWVRDKDPVLPKDTRDTKGAEPGEAVKISQGLKKWPAGVDQAIEDNKDGNFSVGRVEAVLDNNHSAPIQWLRESGRYLSPTGQGDSVLAAAVAVRNCAAVFFVVITTLLTVFLAGVTVRAFLWQNWDGYREGVEAAFLRATDHHWWWSPLLFFPLLVLVLFTLPSGIAFWLTQPSKQSRRNLPLTSAISVFLVLSAGILVLAAYQKSSGNYPVNLPLSLICTAVTIFVISSGVLIYYWLANKHARVKEAEAASLKAKSNEAAGRGQPSVNLHENPVTLIRNALSQQFSTALVVFVSLLGVAVIDSFGQMAYALCRPENRPGLTQFLGVTGLLALVGFARKIKLLLDQLPDRKAAQMPISAMAAVAAAVISFALLVSVSGVAHGFAWQWKNPIMTNVEMETTTNTVAALAPNNPAPLLIENNLPLKYRADLIPAIRLSAQLHGKSRVELTEQNLLKVTDKNDDPPSLLAFDGMSWHASLIACLLCGFLTVIFGRTMGLLNLSSLQSFYGGRIARAYQGASNPYRWFGDGQKLGDAIVSDDTHWRDYKPYKSGGPLHIVNVTLNETIGGKSQIEYRDRQGMNVAVGPAGITVGSRSHGRWVERDKAGSQTDFVNPIFSGYPLQPAERVSPRELPAAEVAEPNPVRASHPETFGYHPLYSGTIDEQGKQPEQEVERLLLRQWIGISGAAFTTGLGKGTSIGKSLLLGLANIRLGYWWDSHIGPHARIRTSANYVAGNLLRDGLAALLPVQAHLFDELLAKFRGPNSRRWYLSDGGHFENTAAYELIRRRVPNIIICDCGCDPAYAFEDLGQLVRLARVDFRVEIEFLSAEDLNGLDWEPETREIFGEPKDFAAPVQNKSPNEKKTHLENFGKRPQALLAQAWHPGDKGEPGEGGKSLLLILKPNLAGDEPLDVAWYKSAYADFPQETTADQFFDESQWESYRKLGRHIAEKIKFFKPGEFVWPDKLPPLRSGGKETAKQKTPP